MTVRRWKRGIFGANVVLGVLVAIAAIWTLVDPPRGVDARELELERRDPRAALGDARELESAIVGAPLQPLEKREVAVPVEPPKVDHERAWIDRAVRVTAFVPRAVVCALVQKDGERAVEGELWFVGQPRAFVRNGRPVTLRLESIDAKHEVAEILWVELKRGFSLSRASGGGPRVIDRDPDRPVDPPDEPVDPPEDPPPDEPERPEPGAIGAGSGVPGAGSAAETSTVDASGPGQVIKLAETRWQLDRAAAQAIQGDAEAHLAALRLAPYLAEGQPAGIRLGEFGTDSLYWRLGLRPGDIATQVNEFALRSLDQVPAIREALRDAPAIALSLRRGGQSLTLRYAMGK